MVKENDRWFLAFHVISCCSWELISIFSTIAQSRKNFPSKLANCTASHLPVPTLLRTLGVSFLLKWHWIPCKPAVFEELKHWQTGPKTGMVRYQSWPKSSQTSRSSSTYIRTPKYWPNGHGMAVASPPVISSWPSRGSPAQRYAPWPRNPQGDWLQGQRPQVEKKSSTKAGVIDLALNEVNEDQIHENPGAIVFIRRAAGYGCSSPWPSPRLASWNRFQPVMVEFTSLPLARDTKRWNIQTYIKEGNHLPSSNQTYQTWFAGKSTIYRWFSQL